MKVSYFILMIIVICSLLSVGCGGSARNVAQQDGFNVVRDQTVVEELWHPEWWPANSQDVEGRTDGRNIFVYGRAEHSARRASEILARDRAEEGIALFMDRAFIGGTDAYEYAIEGDEVFNNFVRSSRTAISIARVQGIRVSNQRTVRIGGLYHTFYELSLDTEIASRVIQEAIRRERQNVMNQEHQSMIDRIESNAIRFGM